MAPEGRGIFPEMTVLENLEMGAFLVKNKSETRKRIEEKYEMFPILRDRRKQMAGSLSGGEQQMLSIARALMISRASSCSMNPHSTCTDNNKKHIRYHSKNQP